MQKVKYQYKTGHGTGGVDPLIAAQELARIQTSYGILTPEKVVAESTPVGSVLHDVFEWDDAIAAEKHRVEQAKLLIRQIEVVFTPAGKTDPVKIRAFHSVGSQQQHEYCTIQQICQDTAKLKQVQEQATREIRSWRQKYDAISAFSQVHKAIDAL